MIRMPGKSYVGPFQPLSPEEEAVRAGLETHVRTLAGEIGARHVGLPVKLAAAAAYIEKALSVSGCEVRMQEFEAGGEKVRNLEIEFPGRSRPSEIVLVGAHYDTVPNCPGANDNTSGTAALLEIARLLAAEKQALDRTVRLVAFVNEEPPFFKTPGMGSWVCAKRCRERGETVVAMLSLETIGCYSETRGSQKYPFPFSWIYPDTANFIAFIGNVESRGLVRRSVKLFRDSTQFPSEGAAVPGWITGVGWSDHWSFWQEGYPAIMVTDTAFFRYEWYHTALDTPEKLDYPRTARVTAGVAQVVRGLATVAGAL